jgi:DNA primase
MNDIIKEIEKIITLEEVNGNYKGTCPYHDDSSKNGSLIINLYNNQFHCFGCGENNFLEVLVKKLKEN